MKLLTEAFLVIIGCAFCFMGGCDYAERQARKGAAKPDSIDKVSFCYGALIQLKTKDDKAFHYWFTEEGLRALPTIQKSNAWQMFSTIPPKFNLTESEN